VVNLIKNLIKFNVHITRTDVNQRYHLIRTTKIEAIRKSKLIFKVEGSTWEPVSEYSLCLMPSGQFFIDISCGKNC